ncbi:MAG: phosphatase PAP2 family protein [Lachnospiraceae bacterium]|jgi:membrane-associated phospholipid phosphatase|nr:phosphatase PAP2 family protein [Lachnospiraceae bacterium]
MYQWIKRRLDPWVKFYSIIPLITMFAFNSIIYWTTMYLCGNLYHYDFTLEFDRAVPFVPQWVYIYLVCYLFWIVNYIMSARFGKERFYRFAAADLSSRVVCLIFFVLLPTTNIRPEVVGSGAAQDLVRWLYTADQPVNLFPSIHCLVSWFCFIAIRGRREIPRWYRIFSCIFALAVIASTQFTKQHYIVDAIGGVFLAEIAWWLSNRYSYYKIIKKVFENINCKLERILIKL